MKSISSLLTVIVLGAVSVFGCTACFADNDNSAETSTQSECGQETADTTGETDAGSETCENKG